MLLYGGINRRARVKRRRLKLKTRPLWSRLCGVVQQIQTIFARVANKHILGDRKVFEQTGMLVHHRDPLMMGLQGRVHS